MLLENKMGSSRPKSCNKLVKRCQHKYSSIGISFNDHVNVKVKDQILYSICYE